MVDWYRGLDNRGRLFTAGVDGERFTLYYPAADDTTFEFSGVRPSGGSTRGSFSGTGPMRFWRVNYTVDQLESVRNEHYISMWIKSAMQPGQYYPRMWRGAESPHPQEVGLLDEWISTVRSARILYARLRDVFRFLEPVEAHAKAYSHELRQLLIMTCTELESAWRSVLKANHKFATTDRLNTKQYARLLPAMNLDSYAVCLSTHPAFGELWPYVGWEPERPTVSLPWYDAYNTVKHDREGGFEHATLGHVINAMAALFVITVAQFGAVELERAFFHEDEFTMLKHPSTIPTWYIRPLPDPNEKLPSWPIVWEPVDHPMAVT